ncbi:hypothetical protein PTT_11795 [Pyrenophora teres f. teres 0-1]|uniref:Uncharacterized protein n=1 Tax=Pyrenophora teres f. teres (strain 0-1) TaxID=861557 RepID=E3RSD8_PYRTT|nr:hypothetical protein PTT_11795 [Pyrenophora teres f. teres 0-1]
MEENLGEESDNRGNINWPDVVKAAAEKGRLKLSKYYSKTDKEKGFLFKAQGIRASQLELI